MSQTQPPVDPSLNSLLATLSPLNLLRSLSHELRAPLAAILGWTEWLLEGTTEAHQPAEGIRHIRSAAEKMLQLLDDYYDLARFGDEEATATAATDLREPSDFAAPGVRAQQAQRAAAHLGADRLF
ncbi:MAG: histidine kinase dimerization/phospho-acceptor domain-containing protein, partial [Chloracidobacterium sp.]